jgi:hypothetical protein
MRCDSNEFAFLVCSLHSEILFALCECLSYHSSSFFPLFEIPSLRPYDIVLHPEFSAEHSINNLAVLLFSEDLYDGTSALVAPARVRFVESIPLPLIDHTLFPPHDLRSVALKEHLAMVGWGSTDATNTSLPCVLHRGTRMASRCNKYTKGEGKVCSFGEQVACTGDWGAGVYGLGGELAGIVGLYRCHAGKQPEEFTSIGYLMERGREMEKEGWKVVVVFRG